MKRCELCKSAAMLYCESDQASLCWDCDAKVHSANFLVARHSRSLLCHVCQSPTAWSASGGRLGRTVSVCRNCVDGCERVGENRGGEEERERGEDNEINTGDDVFGGDEDEEDRDEEKEDGDNQVVPWSSTPPPPATSSSSSEESSNGDDTASVNRSRQNEADLHSDDDFSCSSSNRNICSPPQSVPPARDSEADVVDSSRRLKRRRIETNQESTVQRGRPGSRTTETVDYLKRFREQELTSGNDVSTASVGICKLSDNPVAVDFVSSLSL